MVFGRKHNWPCVAGRSCYWISIDLLVAGQRVPFLKWTNRKRKNNQIVFTGFSKSVFTDSRAITERASPPPADFFSGYGTDTFSGSRRDFSDFLRFPIKYVDYRLHATRKYNWNEKKKNNRKAGHVSFECTVRTGEGSSLTFRRRSFFLLCQFKLLRI